MCHCHRAGPRYWAAQIKLLLLLVVLLPSKPLSGHPNGHASDEDVAAVNAALLNFHRAWEERDIKALEQAVGATFTVVDTRTRKSLSQWQHWASSGHADYVADARSQFDRDAYYYANDVQIQHTSVDTSAGTAAEITLEKGPIGRGNSSGMRAICGFCGERLGAGAS